MDALATLFPYVLGAAMAATVAVLFLGIFGMVRGGAFNAKYANKLMRLRVALQGLAILLFVLGFFLLARQ